MRIERHYPQAPARVFYAFADKETVRRWRVEDEGCQMHEFTFDFRLGGSEVSRFSFMGGLEIRLDAQFHDITPDQRIVFAYRMAMGAVPFSASLTAPGSCTPSRVLSLTVPTRQKAVQKAAAHSIEKLGAELPR